MPRAGIEPLIPVMTSDTTPSGVASSHNVNYSGYAYLAFDGNVDTFTSSSGGEGRYVQYAFEETKTIERFLIELGNIASVKIQVSMDGVTFTDVYSFTTTRLYSTVESNITPVAAKYVRALCMGLPGGSASFSCGTFQVYGK